MLSFRNVFKSNNRCSIIGMIHVGALPGTPFYKGSTQKLIDDACKEAEKYKDCAVDGILIENMNDVPYITTKNIGAETTAFMTRLCTEVRKILPMSISCGVQVLAAANREALAVAHASNLQFIRVEGFVFGHIADEGYIDGCAGMLLRYRKNIGADNVLIFADIKKKHSAHAVTGDVSIEETAKAAEFFCADAVIVTGTATGCAADVSQLQNVKKTTTLPVLIGSGVTSDNLHKYTSADGIIIGTYFKHDGKWQNEVDVTRVRKFMEKLHSLQ